MIYSNYNVLRSFDTTKPYQKKDFVKSSVVPDEADIVENTIDSIDFKVDKNHVYASIGKLFENSEMYDKSRMFFIKNFENLMQKSAPQNDINNAQLDVNRVNDKINVLDIKA